MNESNKYKAFESKAQYSLKFNGNKFPKTKEEEELDLEEFETFEELFSNESSTDSSESLTEKVSILNDKYENVTINENFDNFSMNQESDSISIESSVNEIMEIIKGKIDMDSISNKSTDDFSNNYENPLLGEKTTQEHPLSDKPNHYHSFDLDESPKNYYVDYDDLPDPPSDWSASNLITRISPVMQQRKSPPIPPPLPSADWFSKAFNLDNSNNIMKFKKTLKNIQPKSPDPEPKKITKSTLEIVPKESTTNTTRLSLQERDNIGVFYFNEEDNPRFNPKSRDNISSKYEKPVLKQENFDRSQTEQKQENFVTSRNERPIANPNSTLSQINPKKEIAASSNRIPVANPYSSLAQANPKQENFLVTRNEKPMVKKINSQLLAHSKINPTQENFALKDVNHYSNHQHPKTIGTEKSHLPQKFNQNESASIIRSSPKTCSTTQTTSLFKEIDNNLKVSSSTQTSPELIKKKPELHSNIVSDQIENQINIKENISNTKKQKKQNMYDEFSRLTSDLQCIPEKLSVIQETKLKLGLDKLKDNEEKFQQKPLKKPESQKSNLQNEIIDQQVPPSPDGKIRIKSSEQRNIPLKTSEEQQTKNKKNQSSHSKTISNTSSSTSELIPKSKIDEVWEFEFIYLGKFLDKVIMEAFFECNYLFECINNLPVVLKEQSGILKSSIEISKSGNKIKNDIHLIYQHDGTLHKEIVIEKIKQYVNETLINTILDLHLKFPEEQDDFSENFLRELKSIEKSEIEKFDSHYKSHFYFKIDGKIIRIVGRKIDENFLNKSIEKSNVMDYGDYKVLCVSKEWKYFYNLEFRSQNDYQVINLKFSESRNSVTKKRQVIAHAFAPPHYLAYLSCFYKAILKNFCHRYEVTDLVKNSKPMNEIDIITLKGMLLDSEVRLEMRKSGDSYRYGIFSYSSDRIAHAIHLMRNFLNDRKSIERYCELYNNNDKVALLFNNNYMRGKLERRLAAINGQITYYDRKMMIVKFISRKGVPDGQQLDLTLSLHGVFNVMISGFIEKYTHRSLVKRDGNMTDKFRDEYIDQMIKLLKKTELSQRFHYVKNRTNKNQIVCHAFRTTGFDENDKQEYEYTESLDKKIYSSRIKFSKETEKNLYTIQDIERRRKIFTSFGIKKLDYSWKKIEEDRLNNCVYLELKGLFYDVIYALTVIKHHFEKDILEIQ
jgi:hypothetical protein